MAMNTGSLFIRELRFRPGTFLLGLLAVAAVAACVAGSQGFLSAHDAGTKQLIISLEQRAAERMEKMRDDARLFSKSLGFNILLLPEHQDPGLFYAENRSTYYFTPEQVNSISRAKLATLNHLLPILRYRMNWSAFGGDVILIGIEGEIYIKGGASQKPIEEKIAPGQLHIGDAIRRRLNLNIGDPATLDGESFTIRRLIPPEGNADDISILMNLNDLQRLTGLTNKVSGILGLSCDCQAGDVEPIRRELSKIIPNINVVEFTVRAKARQQARNAIAKSTNAEMEDIKASRNALREQVTTMAGVLVALVSTGTVILLLVLTLTSARERRTEVAMLRALGFGSSSILALFLYKAMLTGLAGGILGCLVGAAVGLSLAGKAAMVPVSTSAIIVVVALLISILASIIPAVMAAKTDPATILNQE
jgi:hypothetical protein